MTQPAQSQSAETQPAQTPDDRTNGEADRRKDTTAEVVVHNVRILDGQAATFDDESADTWIAFGGGAVIDRGRGDGWKDRAASASVEVIDGNGGYVSPAFVDIHCHGAGGAAAEDGAEGFETILDVHREYGTRALALSYVSDTIDGLCRSLSVGAGLVRERSGLLGLHAEGPFLSPDFKGAHAPEVLTAPTPEAVEAILDAADGTLAQITIAPELPGALDAIGRFADAGVRVAIGHTAADYDLTVAGIEAGASILTHAFNAMPGIHHRAPGPILAAAEDENVTLELINDGVHVVGPVARMLNELVPGRIALITDAMAATGMSDGQYMLGSLPVVVKDSVARLVTDDGSVGSIAGSTLTMGDAVRRAVTKVGMRPIEAVQAASLVPLRALGLEPDGPAGDRPVGADRGPGDDLLARGMPADLLLLEHDMRIRRTWYSD
jgi:N-acetylglucosamine-6-phosphate deacetylase